MHNLAPKNKDFWTYRMMCALSQKYNLDMCFDQIIFGDQSRYQRSFYYAYVDCVMTGFILGFPYLIWELWRFIRPALSEREIKYSRGIVFFTTCYS